MISFFKKLFNRNPAGSVGSLAIGVNVTECRNCEKWYRGVELSKMFSQGPDMGLLLKYDRANETFLVNEDMLMRAIQLVNPLQKPRKLKLVSSEEWFS